jgi:murein DD-endopeptidase MepM/ murein hydrolase activator NlpD
MGSQTKLIKDILSTYDTILENKKISEATDVYDNVDFKDYKVGNSAPSKDNINITLLQDIQTAAKNAGVKVDITTAISGHDKGTRHETGNAVDIAIVNGVSVKEPSIKSSVLRFVDELKKLGYVVNVAETSSTPKVVLTYGFKGHDNHVHVSNTTNSTSQPSNTSTNTTTDTTNRTSFAREIGSALLKGVGITEEKVYSSFGRDYSVRYGEITIPKEKNEKIKSPVSGVIKPYNYNSNCDNQLVIKFVMDNNDYYLEYCGLKKVSVRNGDKVKKGDLLGLSDSDITVKLYNSIGNKKNINPDLDTKTNSKSSSNNNSTDGIFTTMYKKMKTKEKDDDDDITSKNNYKDGMFTNTYKTVRDTWFKKDKLKENIDRIKGLL